MIPRIVIACHKGTSLVSRLIRWQTRGEYSHTSLVLPDGRQIEAWSDGVHINARFDAHDSAVDFFTVDASAEQLAMMVEFAQGEVGCAYDWWGDACFVTRMQPSESNNRWFCSELAYAVLRAGHVFLFRATAPYEVSPAMIARSPLLLPIANPFQ